MKTTDQKVQTWAVEYTDKNTGKVTYGIYRYVLRVAAEKDAAKLQISADAIGRPVSVRAAMRGERRICA